MTLPNLITHVQTETRWTAANIAELVSRNWPDRSAFSPTQAALVVCLIRRKTERGEAA